MEIALGQRALFAATGGREFDPAQPSVVFIHGAGMDHTAWAMQTRYFAHHGRNVLALDLPGHGKSPGPGLATIAAMADAVVAVLDRLAIERVALVGHSMGALVALEAAARVGARASALALLGFAPRMPVHPEMLEGAARGAHKTIDLMVTWGIGRPAQIGGNEAPGLWLTGSAARLLERADPRSLASDLAACNDYQGAEAAAAKVACPVLLLLGGEDRMTPAATAAPIAAAFAAGRTTILPGTGHLMMVEDPAATLAALKTII